jgi:hypothetical protein
MKLTTFLAFLSQIKIFHWQTRSYAQHIALGNAYENLDKLFDRFVEVYYGKYGRPDKEMNYGFSLDSYSAQTLVNIIQEFKDKILADLSEDLANGSNKDLLNIKDEIEAEINQLMYLLSLE